MVFSKHCLVIATKLGLSPGSIVEAIAADGLPTRSASNWKCFETVVEAQRWAREHDIVEDGKLHVIVPYFPSRLM